MKPKKSADELTTMIMRELRNRPDCSHVLEVVIVPNIDEAPHHPNWKAGFTADGPSTAPAEAYQIARDLSAQFDWDGKR